MRKIIQLIIFLTIILGSISVNAQSYIVHTVTEGDTYWNISQKYNKTLSYIRNNNTNLSTTLYEGDILVIQTFDPSISIYANNKLIETDTAPYIENSRTFVPIRFISESLGISDISWDENTKTVTINGDDNTIFLKIGSNTAHLNGKPIILDAPANIFNDRTYVPVRFLAEAFDCNVTWNENNHTVVINSIESPDLDEDLYWLSRIVEAESSGEPYEGKLAVANVVLNRKNSSKFPNTVKEVIFDTKDGFQFSPIKNGTIYNTPSKESMQAAEEALDGKNNIEDCLYFLNPDKAKSFWIVNNRIYYKTIDNHDFYV